jgi:hypothetical protein
MATPPVAQQIVLPAFSQSPATMGVGAAHFRDFVDSSNGLLTDNSPSNYPMSLNFAGSFPAAHHDGARGARRPQRQLVDGIGTTVLVPIAKGGGASAATRTAPRRAWN